jgi:hypothetical protein
MGYLIDGYKIMGKEAADYIVKHRAGIGTAVSVGGTIVSNILSTRAGAKSARMIDAKQAEIGRTLTTKEKVKLCWANHIGSFGTAVASCVGAGYSHNQHVKDFNKVATAYAGVKKLYDSAQRATKVVLGEKKNAELQDKLNKKYIEEHPEVKQKISEEKVNPNPGVCQKFWEPVSGEIIYTTVDKIKLVLEIMRGEMDKLKPRDSKNVAYGVPYGVRLRRFFELGEWEVDSGKMMSEVLTYFGFNKGKETNGSDDDTIDVYFTPMILDDATCETCVAINWDTRPSDMRMGDYIKS